MRLFFRIFIISFIIITCSCDSKKKRITKPYSFFVAGHTYGKPGVNNIGLHPPFRDQFVFINSQEQMELGIFTGDIVSYPSKQNWDEVDADLTLLDMPIHFAAGNHDLIVTNLFELRYGPTYQSFIHNEDLFIILDPNIDNWNISGDQLQFLKDTLNDNSERVENIFVFFHQVLWWVPKKEHKKTYPNTIKGRDSIINFWTEVTPLFDSLPNDTYMFAGDVGAFNNGSEFTCHTHNNITLIASGMGAEVRDNFVIVDISENKTISFRLIALNGDDINSLGKLEDYILP